MLVMIVFEQPFRPMDVSSREQLRKVVEHYPSMKEPEFIATLSATIKIVLPHQVITPFEEQIIWLSEIMGGRKVL